MKKIYILLFLTLLTAGMLPLNLSAQLRDEWVKQVITGNGGKFESSPPYVDYVTVQAYDPETEVVNIFNTIYTQSVQDIAINGNIAYVAAQDSIIMYNLDTYQRLAAVSDSGLNKLRFFKGALIVSKQYPITKYFVEVLSATDLSLIARVDNISGECAGITATESTVYVAVNGGFLGTTGKLAKISTNNWTLQEEIDLGTAAVGISDLYSYDVFIFSINKTPFGAPDTGSISRYNYNNGNIFTKGLGVRIGDGFGLKDNLLYLKMNEGMGSFDLTNMAITDTIIVADPGSAAGITIHSGAIDYVNSLAYLNIGNRTSFGIAVVTTLTGDSITSYETSINAETVRIDFRTPTGISATPQSPSFSVSPNPADNYTIIKFGDNKVNAVKIYDLTGKTMFSGVINTPDSFRIDCSSYPSGIYLVSLETGSGNKTLKFIRK